MELVILLRSQEFKLANNNKKLLLVGASGWITFLLAMVSCAAENLP